ncbi:pullulanase-type alpha-1,6-glucosidase [Vibrio fluvialis]
MNTKLTRITIAFASLGFLAACNDGSSSDSQTMSVQAMDGYLNQAVVWLDVNGNFERDSDEPQAITGEQGRAEIDLSAFNGDPDSYTLMTEIIQGQTIDEDLPGVTVSRGYMMSAPKGYRQITPLTTMLHAKMEDGLSEAQALAALREDLNQPDLDPKANYIADGNTLVAQSAKAMAQMMPEQFDANLIGQHAEQMAQGAKAIGEEIKNARENGGEVDLGNKTLTFDENGRPVIMVDSDKDGVADNVDAFPHDPNESVDSDNDGIGDFADSDDDNDGWSDADERRLGSDPYDASSVPADLDNDGIADVDDTDMDNDGALNSDDAFPRDRFESTDTNGDGLGDFASSDDDADGIPDSIDPQPKNPDNATETPTPTYSEAVVYYHRSDANYAGWGLHLWNGGSCDSVADDTLNSVSWGAPLSYTTIDGDYGAEFHIPLKAEHGNCMNFIIHNGDDKALGGDDLQLDFSKGNTLYTEHGSSVLKYSPNEQTAVTIEGASAHWMAADSIAWQTTDGASSYQLWSRAAGNGDINEPSQFVAYPLAQAGVVSSTHYPHLSGMVNFQMDVTAEQAKALLKTELLAVALNSEGQVLAATQLQIPGAVDALYTGGENDADEAKLGSWLADGKAHFALWAPTAQSVELYLYDADKTLRQASPVMMSEDPATGIWHYQGDEAALNQVYYRYRLRAYHPKTRQVEWMMTTDPYSLSLSTSSLYSQLVDLESPQSKPSGWDNQMVPELSAPEDNIIYEVHIRDFSASDTKGTPELNGKYLAFLEEQRDSVAHLKSLRDAGLTTVHLLPSYDLASVPEESRRRVDLNDTVAKLCDLNPSATLCSNGTDRGATILSLLEQADPATEQAQALMADIRPLDSFNWGYDPYHYSAPEGSYAVNSEGLARIKEYRQMVQKLHEFGFRVVQDVVYNHTYSSGLYDKSVLDKTVPGYYHRLNPVTGAVENSTCCDNTASEHRMFEKLVADSVSMWAKEYKIDGFRFDLMGHLMKSSMLKVYEQVKAVDEDTWFYGEGWNFGEVVNGARGENATQWQMAGTGIGTYNDRLRDGVRGGGPFDSGADLLNNPGFANAGDRFSDELKSRMDLIRYGMAGNLQNYPLKTYSGMVVLGKDYLYGDQGAAYTLDPQESVNYVSKHDNQTLWDFNQYKTDASVSSADRARMQIVGLAPVLLGQGVPFLHMGSELLRSKSMARDSYDSGDWVNRVDFSKQTNNWNVGLPRADKDQANWSAIQSIISNPNTVASPKDIAWSDEAFKTLLKIRSGTPLLRLLTQDEIVTRVHFHNTGSDALPGLIAMSVDDGITSGADLDANYDAIVVIINANMATQSITMDEASGFSLHPLLANASDSVVRSASVSGHTFSVPGLTAAVFVLPQQGEQGTGIQVASQQADQAPYGSTTVYLRGSMNGWATSTAFEYVKEGVYQVSAYLQPGEYEFKFASDDWATVNLGFGSVTDNSGLLQDAGGNFKLTLSEAGLWHFVLNASDTAHPSLSLSQTDYACYQDDAPACNLRIYQVMVESFVDGDSGADYGVGYGSSHHKGDLQGIIDSLDYIASVNVNAIWLTPVFDSCAGTGTDNKLDATGYFACDYFNVDPNFGTNAQLKTLIDTAHAKGLYVFLDGVFGHTHVNTVKASPTGKLPQLKAGESGYPGQLVVYPSADSEAFFQEVATYWISQYHIDGWRLDQAYQVPLATWRNLRSAVESAAAANKAAGAQWGTLGYMVGEVWSDANSITEQAYGSDDVPALASAFNFPLRYGLVQALAVEESGASANARALDASWNTRSLSPYHAMPNLMLGNHDLVRFGDLIQRGNLGDFYARYQAAMTFLTAYSGPITLYYGEEIGDEVADFATKVTDNCAEQGLCDDHVSRSSGKVDGVTDVALTAEQQAFKATVSELMAIRAQHPALYNGERRNLWIDDNVYADLKVSGDEQIVFALNTSTSAQSLPIDMGKLKPTTQLRDLLTNEVIATTETTTTVSLPALTGRLLLVE